MQTDPIKEFDNIAAQIKIDLAEIKQTNRRIDEILEGMKLQDQPWTACHFNPENCPTINWPDKGRLKCRHAATCANLRKSAAKKEECK